MKRKYEKPQLYIEAFQLDAAISASCTSKTATGGIEYIPLRFTENTCSYGAYFGGQCQTDMTDGTDDPNSTNCYHGPLESAYGFIYS